MKSFLSIFLICYFSLAALVPRMDFDRLYQIPDLAAHFLEHKEAENVNFAEFIYEHYGDKDRKTNDGHELPFQKHDCKVAYLSFASFFPVAGKLVPAAPRTDFKPIYTFQFTAPHIFDIWHPPRA